MQRVFYRFLSATQGNVAIMFALVSVALLLVAGAAIDYVSIITTQQKLQSSLDAATLAGLASTRDAMDAGKSFNGAKAEGLKMANDTFAKDSIGTDDGTVGFDFSYSGIDITVNSTGHTVAQNSFLAIAGMSSTEINVSSQAVSNVSPYREIYLLIDVSTSMLLPSTPAGIDQMIAATGCALACHDNSGGQNVDSYNMALQKGIELRYQTVNAGIGQLLDYIDGDAMLKGHTKIGLWSFDSQLHNNIALTNSPQSVKARYPGPSVAANNDVAATPFSTYIDNFIATVGTGGNGGSDSQAQKIVFLATDGVNDPTRSWVQVPALRDQVKVFDTAFCKKLQDNNVTLAIVNTPYYPMTWDWGYNATLGQPGTLGGATRVDDVPIALEKCAGNLFLIASDVPSLQSAFKTLFDRLVSTRISQ